MSLPKCVTFFPDTMPTVLARDEEFSGMVKPWSSAQDIKSFLRKALQECRKVLVLDLDETLVHCSGFPPHPKIDSFKVSFPESQYVHKRPGVDAFLKEFTQVFDTYIYTYGTMFYADPILDRLCPMIRQDHRLFRDKCLIKNGNVMKDLARFEKPLSDVILIEDSEIAKQDYPGNTILVPKWNGTPNDNVFTGWLPEVLRKCALAADVRDVIGNMPEWRKGSTVERII